MRNRREAERDKVKSRASACQCIGTRGVEPRVPRSNYIGPKRWRYSLEEMNAFTISA